MTDLRAHVDATATLIAHTAGDGRATAELTALVYEELRRCARRLMRRERLDHTLDATGLVHEAYLKLIDGQRVSWHDATHFRAVAARVMQQVLVDSARAKRASKRRHEKVTLSDSAHLGTGSPLDLLELDDLLTALAAQGPRGERQRDVVVLHFFGGMTFPEVAAAIGISERSANADWAFAKAWIARELTPSKPG